MAALTGDYGGGATAASYSGSGGYAGPAYDEPQLRPQPQLQLQLKQHSRPGPGLLCLYFAHFNAGAFWRLLLSQLSSLRHLRVLLGWCRLLLPLITSCLRGFLTLVLFQCARVAASAAA